MATGRLLKYALAGLSIAGAVGVLGAGASQNETVPDFGFFSQSGNYLVGRAAGRANDFAVAATYLGRAFEDDPNNDKLAQQTFIFDLTTGNYERAEYLAEYIIETRPSYQLARWVLGMREIRLGNYAKAREQFEKAEGTAIGELSSRMMIAWSYAAQKDRKHAYETLAMPDEDNSLNGFKEVHVALIADFLGDTVRAGTSYKKARKKIGNSLRLTQAYGNFLERTGRAGEARAVYATFLNRSENNPLVAAALKKLQSNKVPERFIKTAEHGIHEVMFSLAGALAGRNSANISLVYTRLALSMWPQSDISWTLLGETYESIKKYQKAIDAFSKVAVDSPLRSNVEIQIASNLDDLDKPDEGIKKLDELIAREPDNFEAIRTKASILHGRKRWKEAAKEFGLALARIKGEPKRKHWVVYYLRGISFERSKEWARAEPDFLMALKLRPDHPSVLNYLGYSWIERRKNLDQAMAMVKKAAELRPRDGYIADSVGWAHYQLGEYKEAVKRLEKAVELLPGDPTVNDHLGDAYWRVGRKLEAKFQWAHARDSKPEKDLLAIILKKLKSGLDKG